MDQVLMDMMENQGIWAVLFVFMLLYTIKKNDKINEKQDERENNYQKLLSDLTAHFTVLQDVNQKLDGIIQSQKIKDEEASK